MLRAESEQPWFHRAGRWLVFFYFAILLGPLVLVSLTLPFGWTDHFAAIPLYMHYGCCSIRTLIPNVVWHWFHSDYVVRPTATAAYSLQFLIFGGEFWLWFLAKWLLKFAAVALVLSILRNLRAGWIPRLCIAALLLCHPISTEFNLFSLDLMATAGCLLLLRILLAPDAEGGAAFDIARLTPRRYAFFLCAFILTLGVKEICFAYCGVVTFFLSIWSRRSRLVLLRLAPCYVLLAFTAIRLKANSYRAQALTFDIWFSNFKHHLGYLAPQSPFYLLPALLAIILGLSIAGLFRWPERTTRRIAIVSIVAALAMLVFTSTISRPSYGASTRYVLPSLFFFCIPMGLAWARLPRGFGYAGAAFIVVFPLFQMDDLYVQGLAWQQWLYEQADIVQLMQEKAMNGYQLAVAAEPEFQGEVGENLSLYFEKYGAQLYGQKPVQLQRFPSADIVGPFVVLSSDSPSDFHRKFANACDLSPASVQTFGVTDYGILEKLHRSFSQFNSTFGNVHFPRYDPIGSPGYREGISKYFVYTFPGRNRLFPGAPCLSGERTEKPEETPPLPVEWDSRGQSSSSMVAKGAALNLSSAGGQDLILRFPLPSGARGNLLSLAANCKISGPGAYYGLATSGGKTLYNIEIPSDGRSSPLPDVIVLRLSPDEKYFLFLYLPAGPTQFHLENTGGLHIRTIDIITPTKHYGAIAR